jgi:hypothetical protein
MKFFKPRNGLIGIAAPLIQGCAKAITVYRLKKHGTVIKM